MLYSKAVRGQTLRLPQADTSLRLKWGALKDYFLKPKLI